MKQLGPEKFGPTVIMGQGRDRTDHRETAGIIPEIGLHPPEGNQKPRLDTILPGDTLQQICMRHQQLLAAFNTVFCDK